MSTHKLAVLISGSGRTLENLINERQAGRFGPELAVVVSSKADVRGLEIAKRVGVPSFVVSRGGYAGDAAYSEAIYAIVEPYEPDLIICAGFLKRLVVPQRWDGRILNIHPALIPESAAAGAGFYGERVHAAVLASGARESGATVHVVDNEYDHGPVVMTERVPVLDGDTAENLAARVFAAECSLYPRAITAYLRDRAGFPPPEHH